MAYYGAYGTGVNDGANGWRYLGIWYNTTETATTVTVTAEIWFKDTTANMSDSSNTMYFDVNTTTATTSKGNYTAKITQAETLIATYTVGTYNKGTSAQNINCAAKWANLGATNTTVSVTTPFTVPALVKYTVTYNANGGSGAPSSGTVYAGNKYTISSTKPTRSGHVFKGWATSSTATVATYQPGDTLSPKANTTLYAVWQATYTVTYNANGGSGAPSSQTKYKGTDLTLSKTIPTRTGFIFKGWATSSTGSVVYQPGATYSSNAAVTLYAVWTEKITDILIYKSNNSCEAIEFIEGTDVGFKNTGTVCATEFIEGTGVILGTTMTFGELIER